MILYFIYIRYIRAVIALSEIRCFRTYVCTTGSYDGKTHSLIFSCVEKRRKRTIYIDSDIDKQMRVAAVEDDKFYGEYAEEAFRLFLDKRRKERKSGGTKSWDKLDDFELMWALNGRNTGSTIYLLNV